MTPKPLEHLIQLARMVHIDYHACKIGRLKYTADDNTLQYYEDIRMLSEDGSILFQASAPKLEDAINTMFNKLKAHDALAKCNIDVVSVHVLKNGMTGKNVVTQQYKVDGRLHKEVTYVCNSKVEADLLAKQLRGTL